MKRWQPWVAGFLVLCLCGSAKATGFGEGAHYSYVHNRDIDDNSGMKGLMARLRSGFFGLETAVDYRTDDMSDGAKLKTWPVTVSAMFYPLPLVYGLVGLGLYNSTLDFPSSSPYSDKTDSDLGYLYGAGFEMPLVPLVKLTGDFRYHFVNYRFADIPASIGKVNANAFAINAGFIVYLK
jgi:opacity protein-like surface antigen